MHCPLLYYLHFPHFRTVPGTVHSLLSRPWRHLMCRTVCDTGLMAFNGDPITIRLPLAVDAAVRQRARAQGTTSARVVVAAVISGFDPGGETATLTVTAPVGLIAALETAGALKVGETVRPKAEVALDAFPGVASPVQLDDVGGFGVVEGCEHKRSVTVGALRKCAVCAAVRGMDGSWRVG